MASKPQQDDHRLHLVGAELSPKRQTGKVSIEIQYSSQPSKGASDIQSIKLYADLDAVENLVRVLANAAAELRGDA